MKAKIIGTGLSGLIGSRIVELLSSRFDFIDFSLNRGIDITNKFLIKNLFEKNEDVNCVIHLAAITDVDKAWEERGDKNSLTYKINVLGTRNIARLCQRYNKYLIHFSTDFVFSGKKSGVYIEKDKPNPIEWYGQTKYYSEKEIEKAGCQYAILRFAFPYKAKPAPKKLEPSPKLDLVRKTVSSLKIGRPLFRFADQIITPTFIDDIAKIISKLVDLKLTGIFHCAGSEYLSPYSLAIKIAKYFKLDSSLIERSSWREYVKKNPNSRPRHQSLKISNGKIEKALGVKMKTVDGGLAECVKQIGKGKL